MSSQPITVTGSHFPKLHRAKKNWGGQPGPTKKLGGPWPLHASRRIATDCNRYKFFHYDFFYCKPQNLSRFLPGARVQNAVKCNAPIKTMNLNCDCQKKQGMVVRHIKANYTCFKVIFSWKQGIMHRETP